MESSGQRENGRSRQDQCRGVQTQWLIPSHLMKDQHALSVKIMTILSERDMAFQDRDLALSARKVALAERDMAILQRDTALAERNSALIERDNIIAAFEYQENATVSNSCSPTCEERFGTEARHLHHSTPRQHPLHVGEYPYHTREMHFTDALPIQEAASEVVKPPKNKRPTGTKPVVFKRTSMPLKKGRTPKEDSDKRVSVALSDEWKTYHSLGSYGENLNKDLASPKEEWKDQDPGLNQVISEDASIPVPVCSCTGVRQQCYKWGQGGWQSACCTPTMSVYPLPMMPNKRHARVNGRKMSGSAFTKLLSRMAVVGYDLSSPLDLKDHWAKHGTNRYITIK